MKRGIVLVANRKSQTMCENLIYSIRKSGCILPIRLIHFGGKPVNSDYILREVEFLSIHDFTSDAQDFVKNLQTVLTDCPLGFLYRFLAFFSDWDEILYSDNDIVALNNWEVMFEYLNGFDVVHADTEYTTQGKFNYEKPEAIKDIFGSQALESALTAGHFLARVQPKFIDDMNKAIEWFKTNPDIPKKHDQALLHIASLMGKWRMLNLCKEPNYWLSSWSGDYKNSLELIHSIQGNKIQQTKSYLEWVDTSIIESDRVIPENISDKLFLTISHIHYSGGNPRGSLPIEELLYSHISNKRRKYLLMKVGLEDILIIYFIKTQWNRGKRFLKKKWINIF